MKFKKGDLVKFNSLCRKERSDHYDRKVRKIIRTDIDEHNRVAHLPKIGWWSFKYLKKA